MPGTTATSFDVIVIGGGPAGVTAALRARELGAGVALVERGLLGGACTNDGCVPTRVLAKAARLARDAEQHPRYGLSGGRPAVDFAQLLARAQEIVYRVHEKKQLPAHLAQAGVAVFAEAGEARFVDPHTLALPGGARLTGRQFILCAGGHARRLRFPGSELALTHSDVWSLQSLPASVVIVGAAATGCQLASIFAAFGAQVTLLEVAPRLLAQEDEAVSSEMAAAFARRDIQLITGIGGVERIDAQADGAWRLAYADRGEPRTIAGEAIVLAVGWPGAVEGLGLDAAGVTTARGYVTVDDTLRTSAPHIYAAGDITGRMMLVQSAAGEGRMAAENAALGDARPYGRRIVPHGGFTDPEYASVGLTEAQARVAHDPVVAVAPYADLDRAVIDERTEGFCKLIVHRVSHEIIGAHVVGEQAVEIVQIVAAAMAGRMPVEQIAALELAYPTFTGIVGLAAREAAQTLAGAEAPPPWPALGGGRAVEWERRES
jgi:pyruvate/2-oxoglutarate dehydrogenase complex dihydrolipoamide dehydrogenase (E3) component